MISTTAQLSLTTDSNNTPTGTTVPISNSSDVIMKDVAEDTNDVRVEMSAHGAMDQASLDIRAKKSRWADVSDMDTEQDAGLIPAANAEVENSRAAASAAASADVRERLAPPTAESKPEVDEFYGPSLPPIQCKLNLRLIQNQNHTGRVRLRDQYRLHEILLSVGLDQCEHCYFVSYKPFTSRCWNRYRSV